MAISERVVNHPAYNKVVEYVNLTLKNSSQVSAEQWNQLLLLLLESINPFESDFNSMVDYQIQKVVYSEKQYKEEKLELFADFRLHFINSYIVMEIKLKEFHSQLDAPGEAFLQWLLENGVLKVVKKHFYDKIAHDCYVFIDNSSDEDEYADDSSDERVYYFPAPSDPSDENGEIIQSPSEQSEMDDALPVNYVADRKERWKNPARFAKRIILREAIIRIARLMSETDWQKFDYFIYAGLELYPNLDAKKLEPDSDKSELLKPDPKKEGESNEQRKKRELEPKEIELCGQLKKRVEAYVFKCQRGIIAVFPERYLMTKHRFAQKGFIRQRKYLIDQIKNHTKHGSNKRYLFNRQLIKNIAYSLLVPLDSAVIAEICNDALDNPVQGLSRYRRTFFKDIFNIVKNYNEDADI